MIRSQMEKRGQTVSEERIQAGAAFAPRVSGCFLVLVARALRRRFRGGGPDLPQERGRRDRRSVDSLRARQGRLRGDLLVRCESVNPRAVLPYKLAWGKSVRAR